MENKEMYLKILKGETTLKESMIFLGFSETNIWETMQIKNQFDLFYISLTFKKVAYRKLVEEKEIDEEVITHLTSLHNNKQTEPVQNDIGFKGNEMYIFKNGNWENFNQK